MSRYTNYEGYEIDDESSEESDVENEKEKVHNDDLESSSSDNEFDKPIRDFIEKNFSSNVTTQKSSNKSFENEMENELDQIYHSFTTNGKFQLPIEIQKKAPSKNKDLAVKSDYDNDNDQKDDNSNHSDSDDRIKKNDDSELKKSDDKLIKETDEDKLNDDLLYDPEQDDEDEKWMSNERIKSRGGQTNVSSSLGDTDAVLNCPGCMILICHDCQRHEYNRNQYRAMFVFNCIIDENRHVKVSSNEEKKNRKMNNISSKQSHSRTKRFKTNDKQQFSNGGIEDDIESLNEQENLPKPVLCSECGTELGAYEKNDELYHFYNVLASY
ncbi:unnamed protein product [Didymodactylos carnosus]|uniref:E2F-associated phosphoprotein n=1 Tax=Didymodactylos carnosus TaxID=1234261 RepID=A0A814IXW9_9BILA|nr:unnamed protein product [Didymodactylos carnosus]CAF1029542.1 unnamed protein product [Didymodactylos carnosus]CAF3624675.1 unnamed protein product [Didymodactylos carnosus]CAF3800476.1 unnamed protein product [Didymodactylos carnosus]